MATALPISSVVNLTVILVFNPGAVDIAEVTNRSITLNLGDGSADFVLSWIPTPDGITEASIEADWNAGVDIESGTPASLIPNADNTMRMEVTCDGINTTMEYFLNDESMGGGIAAGTALITATNLFLRINPGSNLQPANNIKRIAVYGTVTP